MRVRGSSFRQILVVSLMVILGGLVGYRYGRGEFPTWWPWPAPAVSTAVRSKVVQTGTPAEYKEVSFDTFWEVWQLLEKDYLHTDKLDDETMVNGAISGMTASLGDPYTMYLPPVENERAADDLAGAFFGVGIELGYVDNVLAVVAPLKGTPSERAGVKAGDLILQVKDETKKLDSDTTGWTLTEAVNHIRGPKGSSVVLTLYRKGEGDTQSQPFDVTLQRDEIVVASVELTFPEHNGKKVAHLKLSRFGERTNQEWSKAVSDIISNKSTIDGVILDMRNNPGGFFDGAIDVSSEFIANGIVVVQKGKTTSQDFKTRGRGRLTDVDVEVLVNRGSASASEIVAGALRDQKGAKLIGEKTFGKGTVQDRRELSNGGGVHITIAQWLLPKGDWIHETGIPVNIEVADNPETPEDEVLNRAIDEI